MNVKYYFVKDKCHIVMPLMLQLVNEEMFWVITEVCSESNLVKRMKIIKQFIKIASTSAFIKFVRAFMADL